MIWSLSDYRSFKRCPRQWYYKRFFARKTNKDPARLEAYNLSKLVRIPAVKGKIVDDVIAQFILPKLNHRTIPSFDSTISFARTLFTSQVSDINPEGNGKPMPTGDHSSLRFYEVEYGLPINRESLEEAWQQIEVALRHLFEMPAVLSRLSSARYSVAQRNLAFQMGAISVKAVPDLISFYTNSPPSIIDWKVHANPFDNNWLQLALYAMAFTRCKRHRDWPTMPAGITPDQVQLHEIQLLTGGIRTHSFLEEEIEEVEETITASALEMSLALGDNGKKSLRPENFPVARDPNVCQTCPFRRPCWSDNI